MVTNDHPQPQRRDFLRRAASAGASLIIGFCWPAEETRAADDAARFSPNAWLEIDRRGQVTIWIGRAEFGQGSHTTIAMMMADELGANWSQVHVRQGDVDEKYGDQLTGGSYSTRYAWANLRRPAAAAREMLVAAAAQSFKVAPAECFVLEGIVTHRPSGRRMGFGDLVAAASRLSVPADPPLRDPSEYHIIGTSRARLNNAEIVTGRASYGLDARVPGMLYASSCVPRFLAGG